MNARTEAERQEWGRALDLEALDEREPEPPREVMLGLPCGYATLVAGHGGAGKSSIELHRAVCIAAERPFFGLQVQRRRVLYLSCEDREGVLHWRLSRICRYLGLSLASLRGWLEIIDLVGHDAVLWERDPRTGNTITPAFVRLAERVEQQQIEVLVVDGTADTFAGNENARGDVKRYINALVSLIPPDSGAVVLIGHVAKPAAVSAGTAEGYSGSTGWHNSVRARWYLYPETQQGEDGGQVERTGDLILELQKSNLGRADQQMRFRWDAEAHLFVGQRIEAEGAFERGIRDRTEQQAILRALRACSRGEPAVHVPAATMGRRTAFHVLSARPEFPQSLVGGRVAVRRFWRHIESLRAMRLVAEESIPRSDRHYVQVLALTAEGLRACGE